MPDIYLKKARKYREPYNIHKEVLFMEEKRYIISDASRILNVESHVLRYWEEELEIKIPRNEMGHRYYTQKEIDKLKNVRDLKRQGYGLRSIRMMINGTVLSPQEKYERRFQNAIRPLNEEELQDKMQNESVMIMNKEEKMEQFKEIMGSIIKNALKENQNELSTQIKNKMEESFGKEIKNSLKEQDLRAEERYKKLDEIIRLKQKNTKKEKKKAKNPFTNCSNFVLGKKKKPRLS